MHGSSRRDTNSLDLRWDIGRRARCRRRQCRAAYGLLSQGADFSRGPTNPDLWSGVTGKARASSLGGGVSCLRTQRGELNRGLGALRIWGQATLRFWREGGSQRRKQPRPSEPPADGQRFFPDTRKCQLFLNSGLLTPPHLREQDTTLYESRAKVLRKQMGNPFHHNSKTPGAPGKEFGGSQEGRGLTILGGGMLGQTAGAVTETALPSHRRHGSKGSWLPPSTQGGQVLGGCQECPKTREGQACSGPIQSQQTPKQDCVLGLRGFIFLLHR